MFRYGYAVIALSAGAAGSWSCVQNGEIDIYTCESPVFDHKDGRGDPDPCCRRSQCPDNNGLLPCAGPDAVCMPLGSVLDWVPIPVLVWHGSNVDPLFGSFPGCPANASATGWMGREPIVPKECPACICSDPICILPQGLIADAAPACSMPGPFTPFPAEADGSCSTKVSIEPNQLQSLGILPPTVSACVGSLAPVTVPREAQLGNWRTIAIVCNGVAPGDCSDSSNNVCVPSAPPGFMQCLKNNTKGAKDIQCPPGYPNKHVYYESVDYQASCTPCQCAPPDSSVCQAKVTAYTSSACTANSAFLDVTVNPSPSAPLCYTVQPNTGLKGLTTAWLVNEPGTCEPMPSKPNGTAEVLDSSAWEFCCADPDIPDVEF